VFSETKAFPKPYFV